MKTRKRTVHYSIVLIKFIKSVNVCGLAVPLPPLEELLAVVLLPPEPAVVLVTEMGAILTAPPKFTIPPEIVPILTPSGG
jgi:hypothetical protein